MLLDTDIRSLAAAVILIATGGEVQAGTITQKGSDTMVILAQKWAEVYMNLYPTTKIQVTGGGSGTGFAALQNRATDLADASRKIKPAEQAGCVKAFRARAKESTVALDALVVFVNAENPVSELSLQQLEGIFTGQLRNWSEVGGVNAPIVLFSRENSSGTYEFFKDYVLKGKDFAAGTQTLVGTAQVLQAVAKQKEGIGFGGVAYETGVKLLKIKKDAREPAVEPTEENVMNGSYPIWRYLYIYLNPALDKGEVAAYLNWIRSDDGQRVVKAVGYYPLPKQLRSN